MRSHHVLSTFGLVLLISGLALWGTALAQDTATPTPSPASEAPYLAEVYEAWSGSPHGDFASGSFTHWDKDGAIPVACAKCHSTSGYVDFLGADGTAFGQVDAPASIGQAVTCDACHNAVAPTLTSVTFPSGLVVQTDNDATRCMVCHQGRNSQTQIDAKLAELGLTDTLDVVSADLGFINIHYYAAAATLYGSQAKGGYEFPGLTYQMQNVHVPGYDTCTSCHDPHTLQIPLAQCATCHEGVESVEDLHDIRMAGSMVDFDGDGDRFEGIYDEIKTLQAMTLEAIQAYAREVNGAPIAYSADAFPYFFNDTNDNGVADADEAVFPNKYASFNGHLLQAAYNYQVSKKDPGGYAHNPVYHIQLLFDSITVLNQALSQPVDLSQATRYESGHFDVTAFAFRYWDSAGEVPAACTKCHTAEGLPFFMKNGVNIAGAPSNSLSCSSCHDSLSEFTLYPLKEVKFPSGAVLSFGEDEPSNMCLNCHQGRESTVSVNNAIRGAGVGDDEVTDKLSFCNIHYFSAGATLFGGEAQGGYQFAGKDYSGKFEHARNMDTCDSCHREHELTLRIVECADCHDLKSEDLDGIRLIRQEAEGMDGIDYDGDGDATEPIRDEIASLNAALYAAIQAYANDVVGKPIAYDKNAHPYWYNDSNGNGLADKEEVNRDNRYMSWTPNLLRAAYNFQYVNKDPGVYVHNPDYTLQIQYDAIEAIGGDVSSFTRPPVIGAATASR